MEQSKTRNEENELKYFLNKFIDCCEKKEN